MAEESIKIAYHDATSGSGDFEQKDISFLDIGRIEAPAGGRAGCGGTGNGDEGYPPICCRKGSQRSASD